MLTTVSVTQLRKNPGQQRTTLNVEKLTTLAEQIYTRGLDPDHPIVVTPAEDGTYRIVRGHRRTMAYVIAEHNRDDIEMVRDHDATVSVNDMLAAFIRGLAMVTITEYGCEDCEWAGEEPAYNEDGAAVCPACGQPNVNLNEEVEISEHKLAEAFDALIENADGLEIPVMVQTFADRAEEQLVLLSDAFGAEDPDVMGQARAFAEAVRLGIAPGRIAANTGLKTVEVFGLIALVDMPEHIQALAVNGSLRASHIGKIASTRGLQRQAIYLLMENITRASHNELDSWIRNMRDWALPALPLDEIAPETRNKVRIETYLYDQGKDKAEYWAGVATNSRQARAAAVGLGEEQALAKAVGISCATCQLRDVISKLPPSLRHYDYPCARKKDATGCLHAVPEGDPWLLKATYQAERSSAIDIEGDRYFTRLEDVKLAGSDTGSFEESAEEGSPLQQQRQAIARFIQVNDELKGAAHPLATHCRVCGYSLSSSPTQDPSVPPCMWARNRRSIEIVVLKAQDGREYDIPVCRQYIPVQPWDKIIPETKVDGSWQREQAERLVTMIAGHLQMNSHAPLRQLTGMPIKADEKVHTWFLEQFAAQKNSLSDGQMITLSKWMLAEWQFERQSELPLELPSGLEVTFVPVNVLEMGEGA